MPSTSSTSAEKHKLQKSLLFYRIFAWITGCMLLVLVSEMIYKYLLEEYFPETFPHIHWFVYIPIAHGWIYFIYLIFCAHLSLQMRWPLSKTIGTLLAGTIPFLSFVVEHKRTIEVRKKLSEL